MTALIHTLSQELLQPLHPPQAPLLVLLQRRSAALLVTPCCKTALLSLCSLYQKLLQLLHKNSPQALLPAPLQEKRSAVLLVTPSALLPDPLHMQVVTAAVAGVSAPARGGAAAVRAELAAAA